MKKEKITKVENGFHIKPSEEYINKKQREERISSLKNNKQKDILLSDIFNFLQDLAERQSEIYDLLKDKNK